ncbi:sushi, von Willebrand factor type A, EGF and pentraxin domain-containing protein 1-like [Corticium candelabrum]|uniref:sushi, von Willebrand factor type A, EGF and pentraxin domain-containing protein 1-like n=1 Tax=Corticium candelabrum TaxID=121492 RepID=UPI002E26D4FE|nr:sushi, von Willebrand factor type A, EGF and pentraxin domain-containing protein 1-like [Corticium candelabrum]
MVTCQKTHRVVADLLQQGQTEIVRTFYLQCVDDLWKSPYTGIRTSDLNCQHHEPPRNTVDYCLKFGCPKGYLLNGSATTLTARCLPNGKWNNEPTNYQCQPKNPCSIPDGPYNVLIISSKRIHNHPQGSLSEIVWGCRDGFRPVEDQSEYIAVQHCNAETGEWTPRIESSKLRNGCRATKLCASELFNDVAKKNMIAKGACDFADMYAPGHCVNISCTYKGYLIDGNQTYTLQCQADGNWTRNMTALQCEPKKNCPDPLPSEIPSNVERVPPKNSKPKALTKLVWRCARGFRRSRFSQTCNAEIGEWEPSLHLIPPCQRRKKAHKKCSDPNENEYPVNTLLNEAESNENRLVWQCEGRQDEFVTQTCNTTTGVWEPKTMRTTCKKKCHDVPPQSPHVVVTPSLTTFHAGDAVTLKCKNSTAAYTFRSHGANRLVCDENGKWNFTVTNAYNCHKVFAYCRVHSSLFAASSEFVSSGTTVRLKPCPRGQYRLGPDEVVCTSTTLFNEPWSNIKCQKKTCGVPVVAAECAFLHKLQHSDHSYKWKTELSYVHKTEGWRGRLLCMGDGKWKYKRIECDPKRATASD